jgi:hypothetical protein
MKIVVNYLGREGPEILSASSANVQNEHSMKKTLAFVMCVAFPLGCGDDPDPTQPDAAPPIDAPPTGCTVTPGAWSAPTFDANATTPLALRAQLDLLVGAANMRGAETGAVTIDAVSDLEAIYDGGTPALSANVHPAFAAVVDDAFAEFIPIIAAGARDLVGPSGWDPGTDGGIFGTRQAGFNTGAIEVRQIVDKGLFAGGALYHYALEQTEGTIDAAAIDRIAAAWGSNATLNPAMPTDSATYSRDMGFHARIAKGLADAKAYAADANCVTERNAAVVTVFRQWEQSIIARAIFYGNVGVNGLATATNDNQIADALHSYAEGIGLAIGFHGLPSPTSGPLAGAGRKITDADLDVILTAYAVNRSNLAASTIGAFVIDTTAFQAGVTAAETRVKQVYQLSDADIMSYRTPTPG